MAYTRRIAETSDEVKALIGDCKVLDPPTQHRGWYNSRIVIRPDGTPIPVLHVIATEVFKFWDPHTHVPAWKIPDWTNESLDNVQLVELAAPRGRRPANKSGHPAGTAAYRKWYREQHPEKTKQWAENAKAARRERLSEYAELVALREAVAKLNAPQPPDVSRPSVDDIINSYTPRVGGGSSPLLQIGTPMTDDQEDQ